MASPLQIHLTTFNCGRNKVDKSYFASSLIKTFSEFPPDIIVLSLQEIAPISYSFLGGSYLIPYFSHLIAAVLQATKWAYSEEKDYEHVRTHNVGMTGIMVFAKKSVKERIRWVEEAGTGVGLWEMGNKGAVGLRLGFEDTAVTFVAAHLAPMEAAWERRNLDWRDICKTLVFEGVDLGGHRKQTEEDRDGSEESRPLLTSHAGEGPHSLFNPPSHIFFAGDLNYRTSDTAPDPKKDFSSWPQPMTDENDPSHWSALRKRDQLTRELRNKKTLHNLAEADIEFPPTYKLSSRAQRLAEETAHAQAESLASKDASPRKAEEEPLLHLDQIQEQVWLWAKHRTPSWCDRILYLESAPPRVHIYTALPIQPTSDHRPVSLSCSVSTQHKPSLPLESTTFDIVRGWKQRRQTARRLEVAVGLVAYLGFTTEGELLLGGTIAVVIGAFYLFKHLV